MTIAAAASRLGRLVHGQLVGVQVTRHGVSPRILSADVVGTKGRTHVTGIELQRIFGLYTTYAAFTTITTAPGLPPGFSQPARRRLGRQQRVAGAQAVLALVPLVHDLLAGATHGIDGRIFPAGRGAAFTVQVRGSRGWRTILRSRLGAGGTYAVALPGAGTYRVVYGGLDGPAVSVG
jgi:stage II sporulation protein D